MFPYLGICHVGVPPRVKFTYVYYAIAVQLLEITMDSSKKEHVPSIDEPCSKIPILSEYCRKLDDHVKQRYLEKIAEVGVDPVTIPDEQCNSEYLLPI